ncbi:unnamed protein product [Schistocephalus solidus]|uniref:Uncharacterized protein n=1 Tax=Schistocephalus solidus TaxID=70667 RepID=A0A183TNG9_SCHSO|nr:unnamed protein product [Schistocephalus solidus]
MVGYLRIYRTERGDQVTNGKSASITHSAFTYSDTSWAISVILDATTTELTEMSTALIPHEPTIPPSRLLLTIMIQPHQTTFAKPETTPSPQEPAWLIAGKSIARTMGNMSPVNKHILQARLHYSHCSIIFTPLVSLLGLMRIQEN